MREDLLYFVWRFKLYRNFKVFDFGETQFEVLAPGTQNYDSGPDFSEAKLKVGAVTLVGNVEIDSKSSDWYKHGHNSNKAFNNVILQVVTMYDKQVICEDGRVIPVLQIQIEPGIVDKYNQFHENKLFVPCSKDIHLVDSIKKEMWFGSILVERLHEKSEYISRILDQHKNSWEDTFYQLLARNFGFKVNADPFEWLAKSIPLIVLGKHHSNLLQIEALFFGQAGFLEENTENDDFYIELKQEYRFLKTKYGLKPLDKHLWKFMRIRPSNFPTIRISQFSNLIFKSSSLFSKIVNSESIEQIRQFFDVEASIFWHTHYQFNKIAPFSRKNLGQQSIDEILINTVIPILFIYGEKTGNERIKEKALSYLEDIKPEKNKIVDNWKDLGIQIQSAFHTQALIQQRKVYCTETKCLECGIGIEILKKQI